MKPITGSPFEGAEKLNIVKLIKKGHFSDVHEVLNSEGKKFALKTYNFDDKISKENPSAFQNEFSIMKAGLENVAKAHNCYQYFDSKEGINKFSYTMDLYESDLYESILNQKVTKSGLMSIISDIVNGQ